MSRVFFFTKAFLVIIICSALVTLAYEPPLELGRPTVALILGYHVFLVQGVRLRTMSSSSAPSCSGTTTCGLSS